MLTCGLVGLPNVGKSTLFNLLTKAQTPTANYPFCTIDATTRPVSVLDNRLNIISQKENSEKIVFTHFMLTDIAGLVKGAYQGKGMGNEFLQDIRKTNALIHVVRTFTADEIIHIDGSVSPIRDIQIIDYEMIFADLLMIEKLLQNKKHTSEKKQFYKALHTFLEHENHIRDFCPLNIEQKNWIKELNCLTAKPMLVLCNGSESTASYNDQLQEYSRKNNNALHFIDVIHPIEEQVEYLTTVIHTSLLKQNTYFTAGINEARSWSVPHGCTAAEAAGKIHSDFSKKMVKAQVISFKELCLFENWKTAYKYGKIRTEGRLYLVQDGDIIYWLLR